LDNQLAEQFEASRTSTTPIAWVANSLQIAAMQHASTGSMAFKTR